MRVEPRGFGVESVGDEPPEGHRTGLPARRGATRTADIALLHRLWNFPSLDKERRGGSTVAIPQVR